MIEWTPIYIWSQIFVLIAKVLMSFTYFMKKRKGIIIANTSANILGAASFYLLNAYSGMAAVIIATIRNIFAFVSECRKKSDLMKSNEKLVMYCLMIALLIAGYFTYNGIGSTLFIIASILYTYSICQKSVLRYKMLGIIVSMLRLLYYIFIFSIVGALFEIGQFIATVWGAIIEWRRSRVEVTS